MGAKSASRNFVLLLYNQSLLAALVVSFVLKSVKTLKYTTWAE